MFKDNEFFTVSQFNNLIRDVISMGFPQGLWVCGEIQGYDRNRLKTHVFFDLCEKNPFTKDIIARIGLVIFSGRKKYIEEVLGEAENAFALKDDIEVKFFCRVDFYPPHGALRLIVEDIDPTYTLGKIAQEKQRLIALLQEKGIFDKNKTLELPWVPLNVGLITAFDSAAYNDFLNELAESGYGFKIFYKIALMQGKGAERDICRALSTLNRIKTLDVIVITRGGGSIADLSCFDSEKIAQKIASSSIPVLSGIGHEINITITDMAAHTYQKTPTAIAQFLVERVDEFLENSRQRVDEIIQYAVSRITDEKKNLKRSALEINNHTHYFLKKHNQDIQRITEIIRWHPLRLLKIFVGGLNDRKNSLNKVTGARLKGVKEKINHYEKMIGVIDPQNTLKRGFSITKDPKGKVLRSMTGLKLGDLIETSLADGVIHSKVQAIKKKSKTQV